MKNCYLFGAGQLGIKAYNRFKDLYNILGFIDNDINKQGQIFINDIKCISINDLDFSNVNYSIIITTDNFIDIKKQLDTLCYHDYLYANCLEHSSLAIDGVYYEDKTLCRKIDSASINLWIKLQSIKIDKNSSSEYFYNYLTKNTSFTHISCDFGRIIYNVLSNKPDVNSILDYGGGVGLLSLLAAECGIKNVYYNDSRAAETVYEDEVIKFLSALNGEVKGFLFGDLPEVIATCKANCLRFDAIISYDVLEHIYDLRAFFINLPEILEHNAIIFMETGASQYYREYYHHINIRHLQYEFLPVFIDKNDKLIEIAHTPFFDIRYNIIKEYIARHDLSFNEIECLGISHITMGMNKEDIEYTISRYVNRGQLPDKDPFSDFKYNTCNPLNGYWEEHIIDFDKFEEILKSMSYEVEVRYSFNNVKEISPIIQVFLLYKGRNNENLLLHNGALT